MFINFNIQLKWCRDVYYERWEVMECFLSWFLVHASIFTTRMRIVLLFLYPFVHFISLYPLPLNSQWSIHSVANANAFTCISVLLHEMQPRWLVHNIKTWSCLVAGHGADTHNSYGASILLSCNCNICVNITYCPVWSVSQTQIYIYWNGRGVREMCGVCCMCNSRHCTVQYELLDSVLATLLSF